MLVSNRAAEQIEAALFLVRAGDELKKKDMGISFSLIFPMWVKKALTFADPTNVSLSTRLQGVL